MPPRKDKNHPPPPANPPSTPLPTSRTNKQPSPPGAPQKSTSSPQNIGSLPIQRGGTPTSSSNQPAGPTTPRANKQPSPPGAPQKPTSSPQHAVSLPIRQPNTPTSSSNQPARPITPVLQGSQTQSGTPRTPKPTGTPPRPASGSATPKPGPTPARRTPPSTTEQSPSQQSQQPPSRALFPSPHLHQSTAVTVLQGLTAALPQFKMANDYEASLGNHESSAIVEVTGPPRFWTEVPAHHYESVANLYLKGPGVMDKLKLHHCPSLDPTFRVRREADVVTYAATHLTHTVNTAIDSVFPNAVESVSEVEVNKSRPDYIWRAAGSTGASETFAMLEMKITGRVDPGVFRRATETRAHAADREGESQETFFAYLNGEDYRAIKQITSYVHSHDFNTRYAALFDGVYLFLGVFSEGTSRTPLLKGTLLPCHGTEGCHARKALLGWLIQAKMDKKNGRNNFVQRVPLKLPPRGHAHREE
ncbi:uncharacterized protein B0H64DRAFT_248290 [Chaetomium fimeti]|uniref:Uncharacterized protein n=1 Tax=Chaetomium fimeti TaxID=1854472 RepID=A0AAE0H826_9PEZI|nr:hypothetical protein B0H64DRAFT_248290 [Chaetomium fimeti]